jgi:hypothetical protein
MSLLGELASHTLQIIGQHLVRLIIDADGVLAAADFSAAR